MLASFLALDKLIEIGTVTDVRNGTRLQMPALTASAVPCSEVIQMPSH
jgi:hypothetical protein